jgi:predicted amidohydrolase YtcJ
MLIRRAEINFSDVVDIRIENGVIVEISAELSPYSGEEIVSAHGNAVIPGLHDHHLHFLASAAALESVFCGPPHVVDESALLAALRNKAANLSSASFSSGKWLRGIGYHESIAGDIDRHWLDRVLPTVPARIQHRSGRLWILNSCALAALGELNGSPLEKQSGEYTGRLFDADVWLREKIGRQLPDIQRASEQLARYGVAGFTDTSANNSVATFEQFAQWQACGSLLQNVVMMGDESLHARANANAVNAGTHVAASQGLQCGALKIHLHENDLPDFDVMCAVIAKSHAAMRPVAVHCVTLVELIFTLNAFTATGTLAGDRIEHAAITPPDLVEQIKQLKLIVVTQPNFIHERGDVYRHDVEVDDQPWLYRLRGFRDAGIALAAGTDAPFGMLNPWLAMQAAVTRRTVKGYVIGIDEALTPERALELFLGDLLQPGSGKNRIEIGVSATLCILDRAWQRAREDLSKVSVSATFIKGKKI